MGRKMDKPDYVDQDWTSLTEVKTAKWADMMEEIKEEENEKFHVFHVKGKGSFSQITAAFGIIKSKERWSAAELCALKREGNLLAYEVEVRAVRNRGTYEKEKYSPDRAYGDGKEPGSQNTRRRL